MGRAASRSFGAQGCSPVKFLDEERQDTVGSAAGRLCGAGADPACVPHREEASREGLEAVRNRIGLYITQILALCCAAYGRRSSSLRARFAALDHSERPSITHTACSSNTSTPASRRRFFSAAIRRLQVRGDGRPQGRAMRKAQYSRRSVIDHSGNMPQRADRVSRSEDRQTIRPPLTPSRFERQRAGWLSHPANASRYRASAWRTGDFKTEGRGSPLSHATR